MATDAAPKVAIKPWTSGIAPNFIGLFLWAAFYDQFGRVTLGRSPDGLRWPALGAAAGGFFAYLFFYYAPAMWGLRSRLGFAELAGSPFGASGAKKLAGSAIGLAQVGWFAVGTYYATESTLRGLAAMRLLDPSHLMPIVHGGIEHNGPLFLGTALLWGLAFAFVGQFAVRLVEAIMTVFPAFPAMVLAAATAKAVYDLPPTGLSAGDPGGGWIAFALGMQLVLGFFAAAAPMAAEWGAASRDARDVRLGGLVGVAFAAAILAVLGLLIVAGRMDRTPAIDQAAERPIAGRNRPRVPFRQPPRAVAPAAKPAIEKAPTVGDVLQNGIGGAAGGAMLFVLALGSMAPAVYAASSFGNHFSSAVPTISRTAWTLIGTAVAFPLIVLRFPTDAEVVTTVLGALAAPLLGAFGADFVRDPRLWPGLRSGWNRSGVLAWLVGLVVGLLPIFGRILGLGPAHPAPAGDGFRVRVGVRGAFHVESIRKEGINSQMTQTDTDKIEDRFFICVRLRHLRVDPLPIQPPPSSEPSRLGGLPPGT